MQPDPLSYDEQVYAIKTWRYLRLAIVVLVVGLGVSIAYERWKVSPGCFQTSISAYYYTPVHGYLVGSLVAVGVCLFCLKGSTEAEDVLLNLAGMFSPVVALVPTPDTGSCASVLGTIKDRDVNIANNVTALLAVGFLALVVLAVLGALKPPRLPTVIGYAVSALVWLAAALVFWLARDVFVTNAHYVAAVLMFVCILAVVWINALGYQEKTNARSPRNRYAAIAGAMAVSSVVIGIAGLLGWAYWVIVIEATLIVLFAAFWIIQTADLWHEGLR
jgi:hypothetical protein